MDSRSKKILNLLNTPKYETTYGLDKHNQETAIGHKKILSSSVNEANVSQNRIDFNNSELESAILADITPNTELLELSLPLDITGASVSSSGIEILEIQPLTNIISSDIQYPIITCNNEKLNIGDNVVLNENVKILSNVVLNYSDEHSKSRENIYFFPNTSCSKDKSSVKDCSESQLTTSLSEYNPSNESIVNTTTDDEINKKEGNGKRNKIHKRNDEKRKKIKKNLHVTDENDNNELNSSDSTNTFENHIEIFPAVKKSGKRVRNKQHACCFCEKVIVQNLARHFELKHSNEADVAKLLALPKKSKERKDGFLNLIRAGDFHHNCNVLSTKYGELILVRRPTEPELKLVTLKDYVPCPFCLGFMLKKHIWLHIKKSCSSKNKDNKIDSKLVIAESNAILHNTFESDFSEDFVANICSKLRDDDIGSICNEDPLILKFGAMQFEKYGTSQCELIRQSMRQLARLTIKLQELDKSTRKLADFLVPQKFDLIIQATKALCISHRNITKRPEFEIPSLALKVGYGIKKCATIQRGACLKAGNIAGNKLLMGFLNLMELEWNIRISSNALATLNDKKRNATQLLPLTSDLIKLSKHIANEMQNTLKSLTSTPSIQKWSMLASLTLTKIILFNKRRSGEASRMTLVDYNSKPVWSEQCTQELKMSLTSVEKELTNKLSVVEIRGKCGRKLPVILTTDTKDAIDKLLETREMVGISNANPYIFARSGNSSLNMRGHDCLKKACLEAGLQCADNITSTLLRKYIATVCQIVNLSENENDWLARHLGHDIRVHREFYRLHESAVELTKVSRLLIAVDKGKINEYKGKSDDIEKRKKG